MSSLWERVLPIVVIGFVIYTIWLRPYFIREKHLEDIFGIVTPEHYTPEGLMQLLKDNNFSYPEMKNIRYDEYGRVVVEGKYTSHAIEIKGYKIFVDRGLKGGAQKNAKCIMEAVVIGHYLQKIIKPSAPVDAYKEFGKFKRTRNLPFIFSAALTIGIALAITIYSTNSLVEVYSSHNTISQSYFTDYSSNVTIGDAFDKFFPDGEWKDYKDGIQEYVDFRGTADYNEVTSTVVFTFWLSKDSFQIDSVKVDNREISPFEIESILQSIFTYAVTLVD